eukprot:Blabericola_migrator_1__12336@NODE_772_length_6579_cov_9_106419_g549_i0_p3_GENE_NODE_772_length_6579_cov_9_106419_g549_i0NODE_772_length_6579_cov_9_106419_g549_i0_p3_ORF_typecomplete_len325_score45_92Myosin_tail_1/PF01576_19/2_2e05CCDC144C/PF14915_6/7_7e05HOOK/PF05622_12/0_00021MAD/PF05557_13/0_00025PAH/PF02671_21/0_00088DUF4201/PF13870_6/0_00092DUF2353/PF09789_9/0_00082Uso1_p115_C/PF04871_13/0_0025FapA/PF03961_13/0_0016ATG16/PF08614_11/0_0025DUF2046/PF09755_9/0_0017Filament/PF00038_21/0_0025GAS
MPPSPPCPKRPDTQASDMNSHQNKNSIPLANAVNDRLLLPTEPEEQLSLAFTIINSAYKQKVTSIETENRLLRSQLEEVKTQIAALSKKQSNADAELAEARKTINLCREENNNLVNTVWKLQQRNNRLESVRKAVWSSIQDPPLADGEDGGNPKMVTPQQEYANDRMMHHQTDGPVVYPPYAVARDGVPYGGGTTTTASPAGGVQHHVSMAHDYNSSCSSAMSPSQTQHGMDVPQPAASHCFTANNSEEGKLLFQEAKQRLELPRFQAFVGVVRGLNQKEYTPQDALAKVRQIFKGHPDLIECFKRVTSKKGNSDNISHAAEPC